MVTSCISWEKRRFYHPLISGLSENQKIIVIMEFKGIFMDISYI